MITIVQAGLIRVIIPKLGQSKSLYMGLFLYSLGNCREPRSWRDPCWYCSVPCSLTGI